MNKTKIVVLQLKEIIYTAIFIGLGILLILLLFIMFRPGSKDKPTIAEQGQTLYQPGVYTTQISLGQSTFNLEIAVDASQINSVRIDNLSEAVATMYPLIKPSVKEIESQLQKGITLDSLVLPSENQYTQKMLIDSISQTLEKALIEPEAEKSSFLDKLTS